MHFRVVANYQFLTNFCIDRCRLVPNLCETVSYVCNTFKLNNTQEETFNFQLFKSSLPDSHTQLVRIAPIINATKKTHARMPRHEHRRDDTKSKFYEMYDNKISCKKYKTSNFSVHALVSCLCVVV